MTLALNRQPPLNGNRMEEENREVKYPRLQDFLKYVMVLMSGILVVTALWLERLPGRNWVLALSGGVLSICCVVFAFLNFDQLKNRKKEE